MRLGQLPAPIQPIISKNKSQSKSEKKTHSVNELLVLSDTSFRCHFKSNIILDLSFYFILDWISAENLILISSFSPRPFPFATPNAKSLPIMSLQMKNVPLDVEEISTRL